MHVRRHSHEEQLIVIAGTALLATLAISLILYARLSNASLAFSRVVTIGITVEGLAFAILLRRRIVRVVSTFFTASAHPINLAIFRIVVFWRIFREVELASIIPFSQMPAGLRIAPWGMGTILGHLPINERLATIAAVLTLLFSITGLIGFYSRTSGLLCLIFGFYALGIPQFYGKVDHYNHLLWFVTLLCVSPCGDFLALDAIFAACKRADRGITDPPVPSQQYALPLRFAMLLLGLIYFFPGFWKLWESGFDWVFGDNLKYQLHLFWTWSYNGAWLPSFRIDNYPFLLKLGAAGTLLFELSFVFMIFSPARRMLAALAGVLFHNLTNRFMLISFVSLQEAYVVMFDWRRIFRAVGRHLYRDDMFFLYDGDCRMCRRTIASLRVFDIFERVTYRTLRDGAMIRNAGSRWLQGNQEGAEVQAVMGNRVWAGFAAYRALAHRIPLLWPALPFAYLRPIAWVGEIVYQRVAHARRRCEPGRNVIAQPEPKDQIRQLLATAALGTLLVLGCLFCGINKIVSGWPFACYPTFSSPPERQLESLALVAETPSGETIPVRITTISYHRLHGLLTNILATNGPNLQQERLRALWMLAVQSDPKLRGATHARFYRQILWTDPELWKSNPAERHLLMVLNFDVRTVPVQNGAPTSGKSAMQ